MATNGEIEAVIHRIHGEIPLFGDRVIHLHFNHRLIWFLAPHLLSLVLAIQLLSLVLVILLNLPMVYLQILSLLLQPFFLNSLFPNSHLHPTLPPPNSLHHLTPILSLQCQYFLNPFLYLLFPLHLALLSLDFWTVEPQIMLLMILVA